MCGAHPVERDDDNAGDVNMAPARLQSPRAVTTKEASPLQQSDSPRFDPRPFIERAVWRFAASVPDKPHSYIVEAHFRNDPDFAAFAALIEAEGYVARFEGIAYTYLRVGDHVYWTSRSLWTPGRNLNRRPWADVAGQPEHEQGRLPV